MPRPPNATDVYKRQVSKTAVLSAKVCLASSIPTYIFAMLLWPGGDDGPGMAWEFVVGAASLANVAGGIPMVNAAFQLDLEYT